MFECGKDCRVVCFAGSIRLARDNLIIYTGFLGAFDRVCPVIAGKDKGNLAVLDFAARLCVNQGLQVGTAARYKDRSVP